MVCLCLPCQQMAEKIHEKTSESDAVFCEIPRGKTIAM